MKSYSSNARSYKAKDTQGKTIKEQFQESAMGKIKKFVDNLPPNVDARMINSATQQISRDTNTVFINVLTDMILQLCKKIPKMHNMCAFIDEIEPLIVETLHSVSKIGEKKQLISNKQFDYVNKLLYVKPINNQEFVKAIRKMITLTKCDIKVPNGKGETLLQAYNFACSPDYAAICAKKSGTLGKSYILEPIVKNQEIVDILAGLDNIMSNLIYAANQLTEQNHQKYTELFDICMKNRQSYIINEFKRRVQETKYETENNYCKNLELLINVWKRTLAENWYNFVELYIENVCSSINLSIENAFDKSIKPFIAIGSMIGSNIVIYDNLVKVMYMDLKNDLCKKGLIYFTTQFLKQIKDKQQFFTTSVKQHIDKILSYENSKQIIELCNIIVSIVFNDKTMTLSKIPKKSVNSSASASNPWSCLDVEDVEDVSDDLSLDTVEPYELKILENCVPEFMVLKYSDLQENQLINIWLKKIKQNGDIINVINTSVFHFCDEVVVSSDEFIKEKQIFFKKLLDDNFGKSTVTDAISKLVKYTTEDDIWSSKDASEIFKTFSEL